MSEDLTNKEIAGKIFDIMNARYPSSISQAEIALLTLAAERLAAMPDVGEQEPIGFIYENHLNTLRNPVFDNPVPVYPFDNAGPFPERKKFPLYEGRQLNNTEAAILKKVADKLDELGAPSHSNEVRDVIKGYFQPQQPAPGLDYDTAFKAIAKATKIEGGHIAISVKAFQEAIGIASEKNEQQQSAEGEKNVDPYPDCERECGGLGQPCLCRIEDPQSSDGGVANSKEMDDWLKTFPKIPWYFLAWCWVKNLLPRCSAKSAGLQCCLRFPHFGPHHADWRVWDRKGVYRDRIGRLEEENPK